MPVRTIRTDLTTDPIFDIDGGVWCIDPATKNRIKLDLPPVTRGLAHLFLKSDGYLTSTSTLSHELKELRVRDIIVAPDSDRGDCLILGECGVLHWCRIMNSTLRIYTTISTEVQCMELFGYHYGNEYGTTVICILNDRIRLIRIDKLTEDPNDLNTSTIEFLFQDYMPEGVKSVENKMIVTNNNTIWMLSESELVKVRTVSDLLDSTLDYPYCYMLLKDNVIQSVYIGTSITRRLASAILHPVHPVREFTRFLNVRSNIRSSNMKMTLQGIDDLAYQLENGIAQKLELPMIITQRIERCNPTKSSRFKADE